MAAQPSTRTYTTPTCTLNVGTSNRKLSYSGVLESRGDNNFLLHIDYPDRSAAERVTLEGNLRSLDTLQSVVSKHIADLVAKFPTETTEQSPAQSPPPQPPQTQPSIVAPESPVSETPPSELLKNLPGLRKSDPVSVPFDTTADRAQSASRGFRHSTDLSSERTPKLPYLIRGNRSIDHQLHLGDLATVKSGDVIDLTALQLFDLATVLDEYAAIKAIATPRTGTKVHAISTGMANRIAPTTTAPELRPNIPRSPNEQPPVPVYRRRRGRAMSALPWVAAATLLVGVPLLLWGVNRKSLKDFTGKIVANNSSTTSRSQTTVTSPPSAQSDKSTGKNSDLLPKPWQPQSVQPPTTPAVIVPTPSVSGNNMSKMGQIPTTTAVPNTDIAEKSIINPLTDGIDRQVLNSGKTTPQTTPNPKSPLGTNRPTKTPIRPNQQPVNGGISVSTQPISILQDPPSSSTTSPKQIPVPPQSAPQVPKVVGGGIDPPTVAPQNTPAPFNTPKNSAVTTVPFLTPSSTIDPKLSQRNPNLIVPQPEPSASPVDGNNITGNATTEAPAVPTDGSLQSNNPRLNEQSVNPALQATKRYFQSKWKANAAEGNTLQYVLDLNGKTGAIRSINPQGEAANDYLKQSKFIKPGQKIAPESSNGDQKIRVLLQADGNVDTFVEP